MARSQRFFSPKLFSRAGRIRSRSRFGPALRLGAKNALAPYAAGEASPPWRGPGEPAALPRPLCPTTRDPPPGTTRRFATGGGGCEVK